MIWGVFPIRLPSSGADSAHFDDGFAKAAQGKGEERAANCDQRKELGSHGVVGHKENDWRISRRRLFVACNRFNQRQKFTRSPLFCGIIRG